MTKIWFEFVWQDLWVGAYWSRSIRTLYVCPLPCCCIKVQFR